MGAWGIRALDSDEGLDVLNFLEENCLPGHIALKLEEIIAAMKDDGFFGDTFDEIDFFYDHSALALTELYLDWLDTGKFPDGELWDIANYVITEDVVLRDGETIGFSEEQKLPITRSKGVAVEGDSLKIKF